MCIRDRLQAAATEPEYGRTDGGAGKRYNVEFVSANPTGPMHMGNARGGALGLSLIHIFAAGTGLYGITLHFNTISYLCGLCQWLAAISGIFCAKQNPRSPPVQNRGRGG